MPRLDFKWVFCWKRRGKTKLPWSSIVRLSMSTPSSAGPTIVPHAFVKGWDIRKKPKIILVVSKRSQKKNIDEYAHDSIRTVQLRPYFASNVHGDCMRRTGDGRGSQPALSPGTIGTTARRLW